MDRSKASALLVATECDARRKLEYETENTKFNQTTPGDRSSRPIPPHVPVRYKISPLSHVNIGDHRYPAPGNLPYVVLL